MLSIFRHHRQRLFALIALLTILLIPAFNIGQSIGLTDAQLKTLLILLLAALLWVSEWIPLFIVSFIILALELTWLTPAIQALKIPVSESLFFSPFFSNIILLFMGGFVLSNLMQKASLDARFAHWILRITKGEPSTTLLGIIIACAFLSMWMSNTATTAMMLTIVLPLTKRLHPEAPFRVALVLAIPLACNLGGIGTPIGTPPNAIAMSYLIAKGINVSFLKWMLFTMPFLILTLLVLWFTLLKLYPADMDKLDFSLQEQHPLNTRQWITVGIFLLTVIGWLIGGQFGFKTGTIALFPIIAAFWMGLLDQSDFRSLPWDVLFMVSGGIALGVAIDITHLGDIIVQVMPNSSNFEILLIVFMALGAVLGTVMSNTATAGLLIPLAVSLSLPTNQLMVMVLAITLNCSTAMVLPVSTPPNAIAFSSGIIRVADLARMGLLMVFLGVITALTIGPLYWFMII
ncbi:MAG: DASS family sodium-coupled anion symporter [Reinekea sp.]